MRLACSEAARQATGRGKIRTRGQDGPGQDGPEANTLREMIPCPMS
jgi:hypothetical protein